MRVNIDEIKEGGLARAWDLSREQVDEIVRRDDADWRGRAPLHVSAQLRKSGRRVLLDARGTLSLTAPCRRCLTPVDVDVPRQLALTFVPQERAPVGGRGDDDRGHGEVAGTFEPTDADEEPFEGKEIDLDPVMREGVILALPAYPACRDDCRGLCSVCGVNLNEKDCGCDRTVPDPRWAGLDKFRK